MESGRYIRKIMLAASITAACTLLSVPAHSEPLNTDQIWNLCNNSIEYQKVRKRGQSDPFFRDTFKSGACFGYVRSLIETSFILLSAMDKLIEKDANPNSNQLTRGVSQLRNGYCLPEFSDLTDQVLNYLVYIEDNPQERPKAALYTFRRAMENTYPCDPSGLTAKR